MNNKIFITGAGGFVGQNIISGLNHLYFFIKYNRTNICTNEYTVIHLAGKAHDLKNIFNNQEYYNINTTFTIQMFDSFLLSDAKVFISLSSVKAVTDELDGELTEEFIPNPVTDYGKSKLLSENYIINKILPIGKRVYILRPCMIHGRGNKGNLNLLYKIVNNGFPWPLGAFENRRSFCSIENLCFIINELIKNDQIPSGIYNVADDEPISTNQLINLIAESQGRNINILNIPKFIIKFFSILGDLFRLPLNTERLTKLTASYVVSNNKIKKAINKSLPLTTKDGLLKSLNSFSKNAH